MVKARQSRNPLRKLEAFMGRVIEGSFGRLFPSPLEPVELKRKLESAMDDNLQLVGEGRRLAPNVYDIYLSRQDHQRLAPGEKGMVSDLQRHLINMAKQRRYTLRSNPVLRLHSDPRLGSGGVRIEVEVADPQGANGEQGGGTQVITPEQLAQLFNKPLPGQQSSSPGNSGPSAPGRSMAPSAPSAPLMPQAWLTIRLPGGGQEVFRIEKPLVKIGRQLDNDIIVQDKRVSRYHATIDYQPNGQFTITDLGSTNHVTINGVATQDGQQLVLRSGDRFTIGNYNFYFERR